MPKNDTTGPEGFGRVVRSFENLPGLGAASVSAPSRDGDDPDFWFPGTIRAAVLESDEGRRVERFAKEYQGRWEFPVSGLRSFEFGLWSEGETIEVFLQIYLFDPEDPDEVFAWCASFLEDGWQASFGKQAGEDRT